MVIKGIVLNALVEEREMTNKEGKKEKAKISHVVLSCKIDNEHANVEIVNIRSYDAEWTIPKLGTEWTTPRVRKYECYDGMVADVSV